MGAYCNIEGCEFQSDSKGRVRLIGPDGELVRVFAQTWTREQVREALGWVNAVYAEGVLMGRAEGRLRLR